MFPFANPVPPKSGTTLADTMTPPAETEPTVSRSPLPALPFK